MPVCVGDFGMEDKGDTLALRRGAGGAGAGPVSSFRAHLLNLLRPFLAPLFFSRFQNLFCLWTVRIERFLCFFKGIKAASRRVAKPTLFVISVMVVILAVGVFENDDALIIGLIAGNLFNA